MSEDQQNDAIGEVINREFQSPTDAGATNEPLLAHLDEPRRQQILNLLYNWKITSNEEGQLIKTVDGCVYPELISVVNDALSHINRILNFTWEHAIAIYISWWQRYCDLHDRYNGDSRALSLLRTLDDIQMKDLFGGSLFGSHQAYTWHIMGGKKQFEFNRPTEAK